MDQWSQKLANNHSSSPENKRWVVPIACKTSFEFTWI